MRAWSEKLMVVAIAVAARSAWADGYPYYSYDIAPRIGGDGVLVADGVPHQTPPAPLPSYISNDRVFLWLLGAPGSGADYFTNDPGFMPISNQAASPSGAPPSNLTDGTTLGVQTRSVLYYWDGTGAVNFTTAPSNATLRWYLGTNQLYVTGGGGAGQGFNLHTISNGGYAHIHMNTYVWAGDFGSTGKPTANPAPNGIYMLSFQATDTGGTQNYSSVPLYGLFDNQLDPAGASDTPYGGMAQQYMQRSWGQDAGGNWSTLANWNGIIPNAQGVNATFWDAISAARTVNVDIAVSVGRLEFRNANAYTLTGGKTITLDDPVAATISAQGGGSPVVGVGLLLNVGTTISNADGGTLSLNGGISAQGHALTINAASGMVAITGLNGATAVGTSGAGGIWIGGTQSYPAGATLSANGGTLTLASDTGTAAARNITLTVAGGALVTLGSTQHLASLQVAAGSVVKMTQGINGVLVTGSAAVSGQLDLKDNDVIVQLTHAAAASDVAAIVSQLAGNNGGTWSGNGIGTSIATGITGLAVVANNQLAQVKTTFDGEAVNGNSILVKYTYLGDTDLDGRITLDDYLRLDAGYLEHLSGYVNGDFNYDGTINALDYLAIDRSFLNQSGALALATIEEHAAWFGGDYLAEATGGVPEPGSLLVMGLGVLGIGFGHRNCGKRRRLMN